MDWTLTQLRYAVALSKTGRFGAAAERLGVAQPTLSMQLQKLEKLLGVVLFDRTKQPVSLTAQGRSIVEQGRRVLEQAQRLQEIASSVTDSVSGTLRMAAIPTLAPYLFPAVLPKLSQSYPELMLEVDELQTPAILSSLENGSLDLGVLATPVANKGLSKIVLFHEKFRIFISPGHKLAKRKSINEKDLKPEEMWLMSEGHCLRNQAQRICTEAAERRKHSRSLHLRSGSLETLLQLVEQGSGFTIAPELALQSPERRARSRSFQGAPPTREISLVFRESYSRHQLLQAISEAFRGAVPKSWQQSPERIISPE